MTKQVILTGLRANNDLHIGNYFGALKPIVDMATGHSGKYQVNLFIPDLHSFTTPIDHSQLKDQIDHVAKIFIAAGLPMNNPDVFLYRQSHISAHSELTWILDCFIGMGSLGRMTQYKDKSSTLSEEKVSVGLFNYPVLMAADILLYGASYVPVGDDQSQHLEFTRDIAERMNSKFSRDLFVVPHEVKKQHEFFGHDQGLRIKDLQDPSKKMSKSDATGKGVIFLNDSPADAHKKVMSATTDSLSTVTYDHRNQPGISNLIDILALLEDVDPHEIAKRYKGQTKYGEFKNEVAGKVSDFLTAFQQSFATVSESQTIEFLERSEDAMRAIANDTLLEVQKAVGLR